MPRVPGMGLKAGKKIKLGTTVLPTTSRGLAKIQKALPKFARTQGEALDLIVLRTLGIKSDDAAYLCKLLDERIDELQLRASRLPVNSQTAMEIATLSDRADALIDYEEMIRQVFDVPVDGDVKMGKVMLANGDYVTLPEDYILINPAEARSCSEVGVIEVRGGAKYGAPHFAFFTNDSGSLSKLEQEQLLAEAASLWPPLKQVIAEQVPLRVSSDGKYANADEHLAAPIICFFNVLTAEAYDRLNMRPSAGVAIYRAELD